MEQTVCIVYVRVLLLNQGKKLLLPMVMSDY